LNSADIFVSEYTFRFLPRLRTALDQRRQFLEHIVASAPDLDRAAW
jgi:hypothetical protein